MVERSALLRRLRSVRQTIVNVRSVTLFVGVETRLRLTETDDDEIHAEWKNIVTEVSKFKENVVPALKDLKRGKKRAARPRLRQEETVN
jgi:hypothetical protein